MQVKSNAPPDNPAKCVNMLDVEDLQVCICLTHTCFDFLV